MNNALPVENGTYFFSSFAVNYTKIMGPFCTFMNHFFEVLRVPKQTNAFVVNALDCTCLDSTHYAFCVRALIYVQSTYVVIDQNYKTFRASTSWFWFQINFDISRHVLNF